MSDSHNRSLIYPSIASAQSSHDEQNRIGRSTLLQPYLSVNQLGTSYSDSRCIVTNGRMHNNLRSASFGSGRPNPAIPTIVTSDSGIFHNESIEFNQLKNGHGTIVASYVLFNACFCLIFFSILIFIIVMSTK
jgi:hypothetical protein